MLQTDEEGAFKTSRMICELILDWMAIRHWSKEPQYGSEVIENLIVSHFAVKPTKTTGVPRMFKSMHLHEYVDTLQTFRYFQSGKVTTQHTINMTYWKSGFAGVSHINTIMYRRVHARASQETSTDLWCSCWRRSWCGTPAGASSCLR